LKLERLMRLSGALASAGMHSRRRLPMIRMGVSTLPRVLLRVGEGSNSLPESVSELLS